MAGGHEAAAERRLARDDHVGQAEAEVPLRLRVEARPVGAGHGPEGRLEPQAAAEPRVGLRRAGRLALVGVPEAGREPDLEVDQPLEGAAADRHADGAPRALERGHAGRVGLVGDEVPRHRGVEREARALSPVRHPEPDPGAGDGDVAAVLPGVAERGEEPPPRLAPRDAELPAEVVDPLAGGGLLVGQLLLVGQQLLVAGDALGPLDTEVGVEGEGVVVRGHRDGAQLHEPAPRGAVAPAGGGRRTLLADDQHLLVRAHGDRGDAAAARVVAPQHGVAVGGGGLVGGGAGGERGGGGADELVVKAVGRVAPEAGDVVADAGGGPARGEGLGARHGGEAERDADEHETGDDVGKLHGEHSCWMTNTGTLGTFLCGADTKPSS